LTIPQITLGTALLALLLINVEKEIKLKKITV
jgi:hypothetical protein